MQTALSLPSPELQPRRPQQPLGGLRPNRTRSLLQEAFGQAQPRSATSDKLLAHLRHYEFEKGPILSAPPREQPAWWLLIEGRLAAGRQGQDGGTLESRILDAGQWFDVASAWMGGGWLESAVCLTPVTLAAIPLDILLECARDDEQLQWGMGYAMAAHIQWLTEGRHELATKDVLGRLALWLLRQSEAAQGNDAIRLPMQKRAIARQLVMAQATLSRTLRRLVALGCIDMRGYTVTLRDRKRLQELAGQADAPA